jgi:hypothetical protein
VVVWAGADREARCGALNASRAALAGLADDPATAADRAALRLVIDLAATAAAAPQAGQ